MPGVPLYLIITGPQQCTTTAGPDTPCLLAGGMECSQERVDSLALAGHYSKQGEFAMAEVLALQFLSLTMRREEWRCLLR